MLRGGGGGGGGGGESVKPVKILNLIFFKKKGGQNSNLPK